MKITENLTNSGGKNLFLDLQNTKQRPKLSGTTWKIVLKV